jgi:hypothetical protein
MILGAAGPRIPSSPIGGALVALVLFGVSIPIIRRVVRKEQDPRLRAVLVWSLVLHFLAAPAQVFIVNHVYHGVSDFTRYVHQGTLLVPNFRAAHFTLAGSGVHTVLGDGSVSIAAGAVFTLVGVNEIAGFVFFAWLSFLGSIAFYRAFSTTFPEADRRRYALLLFFLPSLIFWTSDVSKEAIMTISLGIAAYGAARVLARQRRGYPLVVLGSLMGVAIRPNELALFVGAFTIAMFFRRRDPSQNLGGLRRLSTLLVLVAAMTVLGVLTVKFLHTSNGSVSGVLHQIGSNNTGQGAGFGSSNVAFSADPLLYPRDVYNVLFDPLPITARSSVQFVAAIENTIILVLVLTSLRRLRVMFRAARARPYVMLCLAFSAAFLYAFAALGNLGLIERERVVLFPFFLVLLSIPLSAKGEEPQYPWEQPRPKRRDRHRAQIATPALPGWK